MIVKLYTDGAVNPQTNQIVGVGAITLIDGKQYVYGVVIPEIHDNHATEFLAAAMAFQWLSELADPNELIVQHFSDSKLLVDSIRKTYAKHYANELQQLLDQLKPFQQVITQWVSDHDNQGAHQQALQALAKYQKSAK